MEVNDPVDKVVGREAEAVGSSGLMQRIINAFTGIRFKITEILPSKPAAPEVEEQKPQAAAPRKPTSQGPKPT